MSQESTLLVEKLWRLKRLVAKGACPGLQFVHLNNMLREPGYRNDVLARVEASGSDALQRLAAEIRAADDGQPLMQKSVGDLSRTPGQEQTRRAWLSPSRLWLLIGSLFAVALTLGFTSLDSHTVQVKDDIINDTIWQSGRTYILENTIFVDGADLIIEPGVQIKGKNGSALIVTKYGRLFSRGQADSPVVFTSTKPEGQRARGDWGGVVLMGKAPVNEPNAAIEGLPEGNVRGLFGGNDENHSCGVMEFTRIEFAGHEISQNNELNGLTLGGCGRDTIIRNVQVHRTLDDGIELFGGTVDLKNIVISGAGDDSIDWDWGWTGRVQFAVIQQHPDVGDNAFEGDNNGNNHQAQPRSQPTFFNVTLAASRAGVKAHRGMVLREGSGGHFHNMIIDGYGIEALDLRDDVNALVDKGELSFSHNVLANVANTSATAEAEARADDDFGFSEDRWIRTVQSANAFSRNSVLGAASEALAAPDFQARLQGLEGSSLAPPESEFFDESATYPGALNPKAQIHWLSGWTAFPEA